MCAKIEEMVARIARDRAVQLEAEVVLDRHRNAASQAIETLRVVATILQAAKSAEFQVDVGDGLVAGHGIPRDRQQGGAGTNRATDGADCGRHGSSPLI